jgi:hypothetical protein
MSLRPDFKSPASSASAVALSCVSQPRTPVRLTNASDSRSNRIDSATVRVLPLEHPKTPVIGLKSYRRRTTSGATPMHGKSSRCIAWSAALLLSGTPALAAGGTGGASGSTGGVGTGSSVGTSTSVAPGPAAGSQAPSTTTPGAAQAPGPAAGNGVGTTNQYGCRSGTPANTAASGSPSVGATQNNTGSAASAASGTNLTTGPTANNVAPGADNSQAPTNNQSATSMTTGRASSGC